MKSGGITDTAATGVVIYDEATRRVLEAALWSEIGDTATGLHDDIYTVRFTATGDTQWGDYGELASGVDRKLARVALLRSAIERVQGCEPGDRPEVPISPERLAGTARHIARDIEEDEEFWSRSADQREAQISYRDAAARLAAEFGVEVAAG